MITVVERRKLAQQYPVGTDAPDIDFVEGGTLNLPNGGLLARFPGLHIPILDFTFNGPAPTDTQFDTVVTNRQYDGFADFPLYPINLIADLNAILGMVFVHFDGLAVSLADDPAPPTYQGTHGRTSYYFFETEDLPLFEPLRILGVPERLIDVVEPFFRVIVELGYDRSIPPWEPTPARLRPMHDPATVAGNLSDAIGEGIENALRIGESEPAAPPSPPQSGNTDAARFTIQPLTAYTTPATADGQQFSDSTVSSREKQQVPAIKEPAPVGEPSDDIHEPAALEPAVAEPPADTDTSTTDRGHQADKDRPTSADDPGADPDTQSDRSGPDRSGKRGPVGLSSKRIHDKKDRHSDGTSNAGAPSKAKPAGGAPAKANPAGGAASTGSGDSSAGGDAD